MAVVNNKKGGNAVIRQTVTGNVTLADLQTGGETVSAASISSLAWSTNGSITIARGANTIINLHNTGQWDLNIAGGALAEDKAADFVITIVGGGTVLIGVSKTSSITGLEPL